MPLPLLALLGVMGGVAGTGAAVGAARRAGKTRNPLEEDENAQVIDQSDDGPLLSALDFIGHIDKAKNNALMGNWEGVGRQAVDFLGDIVDAPLPGDWIPHISRRMDKPEFSDVAGGMEDGLGKFAVDLAGGVATDPTSIAPVGKIASVAGKGLAKAGSAVEGVAKQLPKGAEAVDSVKTGAAKLGRGVRSTFGAQRISPKTQSILDAARAAKSSEAQSGIGAIKGSVLNSLTPDEANVVGDVLDNFRWENGKITGELGPSSLDPIARLKHHPGVTPETLPKLQDAVAEAMHIGQQQAKREGIFSKRTTPDPLTMGATYSPQTAFKGDYLPRTFTGQTEEQALDELLGRGTQQLGSPNAVAARKLDSPQDVAAHLAENPKAKYERNAVVRLGKRSEQQGTLAQRAEIGKAIMGKEFAYADPEMRAGVVRHIEEMAKTAPEDAKVLLDAFKGIAPRGAVMDWLSKANRAFKPAAVYGFAIPKFGSLVRNTIGGAWQALSNPESRGVAMKQLGRLDSTLAGAVADSLGLTYPRDKLAKVLRTVDQAFSQSGGLTDNALGALERAGTKEAQEAAGLIRSGVLDGFVTSENLVTEMARTPRGKKMASILDWPGRMFRGVEDRMRAGMYLDLVAKGKMPEEAARITRDSLYDYAVSSVGNRRARDVIPFFQFQAKAIPQQAKFLTEQPAVAAGLEKVTGDDPDAPVYPYLEGKFNVPLGTNEEGNQQYASGLGLPFEALNQIPSSFRDVKRNMVGQSSPLLKSLFAAVSGEDPYFETPYGSYDKMPVLGEQGDLGRLYNMLAGTGLIQPLDSPLRSIDKLLDDRQGLGTTALDMLTGARVVNVDPDLAMQQQLQEALLENPDVRQYRGYYADEGDEPTQALIREFQKAKARMKAKRAAAD